MNGTATLSSVTFPTRSESMSLDESHLTAAASRVDDDGPPDEAMPRVESADDGDTPVDPATEVPSAAPPEDDGPDEVLGTTSRDRIVLAILVTVCLVQMTWQWAELGSWGRQPIEIERQTPLFQEHRLDPNTATWVELMQLEGVGEVLGRRIVEDREAHGPFESVDDLQRVSGIGAKTIEKLRPWLEVGGNPRQPSR